MPPLTKIIQTLLPSSVFPLPYGGKQARHRQYPQSRTEPRRSSAPVLPKALEWSAGNVMLFLLKDKILIEPAL